jgi:hypothetical protein
MPNYAVHDSEGNIRRTLTVRADELALQPLAEGEYITEVDHARPHDLIDVATGSVIQKPAPEIKLGEDWVLARKALYGPAELQMGMLFDGMKESGIVPEWAQAFFDHNERVKAAIPKDTQIEPTIIYTVDAVPPAEGSE